MSEFGSYGHGWKDGLFGGILAGVLVTGLLFMAIYNIGGRKAEAIDEAYHWNAIIVHRDYSMRVEVLTPQPIDPTQQHGLIFEAQSAAQPE